MNPTVYDSVAALCDDPDTTVVVFSGSDKWKLEETFGELDVWLAAENGMFMRAPDSAWSNLLEVTCRDSLLSFLLASPPRCLHLADYSHLPGILDMLG